MLIDYRDTPVQVIQAALINSNACTGRVSDRGRVTN